MPANIALQQSSRLSTRETISVWKTDDVTDRRILGATENAGVENAIRSKLQGWKMQEWKIQE